MRILAVLAHPSNDSFDAAVFQQAVTALTDAGHDVGTLDLYRAEFPPLLTVDEWRANAGVPENRAPVASEVAELMNADMLLLVFPTWWSAMPAILKGWLDRVFLPGVAFELQDGSFRPLLTKLRYFAVITTCGARWWQVLLLGDPVRVLFRALRLSVAPQAKPIFLRLHRMDSTTALERARFLDRVRSRLR